MTTELGRRSSRLAELLSGEYALVTGEILSLFVDNKDLSGGMVEATR